jgi:predicted GTPase
MAGTNRNHGPTSYEAKFADFIRMLAETKEEMIVIHHPEVLGDTFDEIVESLNRLADAEKHLAIVPRDERK